MVVGLVVLGIITGFGGALTSLILGYSFLAALGFYVLSANAAVFAVIGLHLMRHVLASSFSPAHATVANKL